MVSHAYDSSPRTERNRNPEGTSNSGAAVVSLTVSFNPSTRSSAFTVAVNVAGTTMPSRVTTRQPISVNVTV
jgi:hypothetical protein